MERIKHAQLKIENPIEKYKFLDGVTLKVAVTRVKGRKGTMEQISKGGSPYHFIEVMGCPGGWLWAVAPCSDDLNAVAACNI